MCLIYVAQQAIRIRSQPLNTLLSDVARHEITLACLSQLQEKHPTLRSDIEKNIKEMNTWKTRGLGITLKSRGGGGGGSRSGEGWN